MENIDWKKYLIAFAVAFVIFTIYDYFFASKQLAQNPELKNQTEQTQKEVKPSTLPSAEVNLYLGTAREKNKPQHFIIFETEKAKIKVAEEGAKIVSFYDKKFKKELVENYERSFNIYPLEILTSSWETTKILNFERYNCKKEGYTLTCLLNHGNLTAVKRFVISKDGYISKVEITLKGVKNPYLYLGMTPFEKAFYTHIGPLFKTSDGQILRIDIDDVKGVKTIHGDFIWSGQEGRYFLKAVKYNTHTAVLFGLKVQEEGEEIPVSATAIKIKPETKVMFFNGPKEYEVLKNIQFTEAIDFGVLHFLAYPMFLLLYWIYKFFHSWVAAIFILTLLVRIIFFPLSITSTKSMKKMQELAPKLEELKKKYGNDPQKLQQELLKLYKDVGFNPASGCLPILVQIPIFFALYKVLIVTPDLALEGFLWIPSLADKDPYFILPVLMGLTMVAQTFLTPSPQGKQNTMMYLMAAVFTFLFATFPSGLVLYWTLNNIFNLIQTWIIYKYLA
jgi:YidC/Oxa1 family membrane protein insertase